MKGCSAKCGRGCSRDFSSRAPQKPSLVDIEVVSGILSQAFVNTFKRASQVRSGELDEEILVAKSEELSTWLGNVFCGESSHFEVGAEHWNPEGLSEYFREFLKHTPNSGIDQLESPEAVVQAACAVFVKQAIAAAQQALDSGFVVTDGRSLPAPLAQWIENWTLLFVGAPLASGEGYE